MPAGVDYNGKVDPNFAPLKATRKWGAPATPSEQPAPSPTTTSSTIDKPSSATPARPRSPPPTRAPPVALQADVSTVSSSGPPANAKRDWNVGDSYNPPSSEHDSRRDRPMFDPRPSMSRSRFELERERDRRYREAGPKSDILSADLPPEEPWESARIQQRLAHEAHLKRVADAKVSRFDPHLSCFERLLTISTPLLRSVARGAQSRSKARCADPVARSLVPGAGGDPRRSQGAPIPSWPAFSGEPTSAEPDCSDQPG